MAATMGSNKGRESRHFWGQNMTVPRSFQNMGSINIAGVGDVYVVTQDPSTDQVKVQNALTPAFTGATCHGCHHGLKQGQGVKALLGSEHDCATIFPEHGKH
jgi:hypothetical protein